MGLVNVISWHVGWLILLVVFVGGFRGLLCFLRLCFGFACGGCCGLVCGLRCFYGLKGVVQGSSFWKVDLGWV